MKLSVMKIAVLAVLVCCNLAEALTPSDTASAIDRHNRGGQPQPYHSQPMETPETGRNADQSQTSECIPDSDGSFGAITANGVTVQYYYEIEFDTSILHKVSNRILKAIQNKITDYLLPVLFHSACSDSRRDLAQTLRRRLEAVGISALPDDVIVNGGTCGGAQTWKILMFTCLYFSLYLFFLQPLASCASEPSGGGVSCSLAFGQASIFAQDSSSAKHQGDRAVESIEIIMKDGGLDDIVPGILKVSYVNGTHVKGVNGNLQTSSSSGGDGGEGLPGYAIALIIVGVVGAVAVALFMFMRKRKQRADERRANANPGALAFEELSLDGRSSYQ